MISSLRPSTLCRKRSSGQVVACLLALLGALALSLAACPAHAADSAAAPNSETQHEAPSIRVSVAGFVARPGLLRLKPDATVLDALAGAGGLAITRETARISILRVNAGGKALTLLIDLMALLDLKDLSQNARLRDNDLLVVAQVVAIKVSVAGEVVKPGTYALEAGEGLAELLTRAGGFTEKAALRSVKVTHHPGEAKVHDLTPLREGMKISVPLENGDVIEVPRNEATVAVVGEVMRPGQVIIPENHPLTLGEALARAGGLTKKAHTNEVALLRLVDGKVQEQIVVLDRLYEKRPATEMALQNGDVILVRAEQNQSWPKGRLWACPVVQFPL